jgi:RNA polymerase sigma-70 factor (ECF subfamily)
MGTPDPRTLRVQQLFVRHQGQLRAFVLAVWPDFARADDVLQEVFLTVTAKAADFREGSNFLAWSRAIAQRKVFEARRLARKPTISPDVLESLAAACPEAWAEDRRLARLAECLNALPPRAQELVRLRYHREHSPPDIARLLGRTVNSVNVALAKARVALRECVNRHLDPSKLPAT